MPGDVVRVHGGTYREWVDPKVGGIGEHARIIFEAAPGEHPVIKGSEIVTGWERVEGGVWKAVVPNAMFNGRNPYAEALDGDWFRIPTAYSVHTGDVYLNGKSLYEASSLEALYRAERREMGEHVTQSLVSEYVRYSDEDTVYQWFAEVDAENTTIYGQFHEYDPNRELVEINVRQSCFRPTTIGVNYITLRGFEIAHAATPWNPPSADQIGMVGPYWSKGWIIENCDLHDAKTSAVCLGKEASTGDNLGDRFGRKSSHIYQMEAVFLALKMGWSKENVGSHVVRNNRIHDCGANGIVGHMGCIFSRIEHNHIYNIGVKHEFGGDEIAGIKFHAPIDTVIENNHIHDCTLGVWLDWQSQGTRLTRNLFHHNNRDLEVEVTHGPLTVDHNILLSPYALDNYAQGTAFVHNMIAGVSKNEKSTFRQTPYHLPHSTAVLAVSPTYGGDDRVINNLLLGTVDDACEAAEKSSLKNLSSIYDGYSSEEEYPLRKAEEESPTFSLVKYATVPQPVYIDGNAYGGYAMPFRAEKSYVKVPSIGAELEEQGSTWTLTLTVPEEVAAFRCEAVSTERLGNTRITEGRYENPDGTSIDFTRDFLGNPRGSEVCPGPFTALTAGQHRIVVWED